MKASVSLVRVRWVAAMALIMAAALLGPACNKSSDVGKPCAIPESAAAAAPVQGYAGPSSECESRICLKPIDESGMAPDTSPTCTADCSSDADCDGETREPSEVGDKRCRSGFVCGVPFEVGPLACRRLCMCKDFLQAGRLSVPVACTAD